MSETTARPVTGNIYDLGYRPYDGERLGRRHAFKALFTYTLKAVFGIGRSGTSKLFPIGLAVLAMFPSALQLAVAALSPAEVTIVQPESYFSFVEIVVALFVAVVAPEMIGRDARNRALPLYFSRALTRNDYVSAKVAALFVAILGVMLVPQLLLFAGNALATEEVLDYLQHNVDELAPILISCVAVALALAAISLALAAQSPKRALSTAIVIAFFIIMTTLGRILVDTTTGDVRTFSILLSPLDVLEGFVYWLFDARPTEGTPLSRATLAAADYVWGVLAYTVLSLFWLYRRFNRMTV